ncbi:MAG: hypothetical protein ACKOPM_17335 [Novosphingobium sp.]|jgi:hypothetical protein
MDLPTIDPFALPDLDNLTATCGSLCSQMQSDDTVILIMVFVYETTGGK